MSKRDCKVIQNAAVVPSAFDKRSAVSAVIPPLALDNLVNPPWRNLHCFREPVLADLQGVEKVQPKDLTRVNWRE